MNEAAAREAVVHVCRRLYERGLIAGGDGNVSVRLAADRLLATPAGRAKGELRPEELVLLDLDGGVVGAGRASTEIRMHLRLYRRRADVGAVVHAHPPTATAFAVIGESLMAGVLPEIILGLGEVPLVPYATPGTEALPDALEPFIDGHDAWLLANHGATTVGTTLEEAHLRMESLEHAARILRDARLLGRVNRLTEAQQRALESQRAAAKARESKTHAGPQDGARERS